MKNVKILHQHMVGRPRVPINAVRLKPIHVIERRIFNQIRLINLLNVTKPVVVGIISREKTKLVKLREFRRNAIRS